MNVYDLKKAFFTVKYSKKSFTLQAQRLNYKY